MKRFVKVVSGKAGISLTELQITVLIIAILVAIAYPAYNLYVYKSRQTEAKTALAALYGAMTAFEAEHDDFTPRFDVIGFTIGGQLRYRTGFMRDRAPPPSSETIGFGTCTITGTPATKPACSPGYEQAYDITTGPAGADTIVGMPAFDVTPTSFRAYSLGRSDGVNIDSWSIDNLGVLLNN